MHGATLQATVQAVDVTGRETYCYLAPRSHLNAACVGFLQCSNCSGIVLWLATAMTRRLARAAPVVSVSGVHSARLEVALVMDVQVDHG